MFEDEAESSRRWQRLTIDGKVRTIDIVFTEGVGSSAAQASPCCAHRLCRSFPFLGCCCLSELDGGGSVSYLDYLKVFTDHRLHASRLFEWCASLQHAGSQPSTRTAVSRRRTDCPTLRACAVPRPTRGYVFIRCAGPGFIAFALLANGFADAVVLADVNPLAIGVLAAARRPVCRTA